MKRKVLVYITVLDCGIAFGCVGQIRSARNGRVLWESSVVRPHGFHAAARMDALTAGCVSARYTLSDKSHHRES